MAIRLNKLLAEDAIARNEHVVVPLNADAAVVVDRVVLNHDLVFRPATNANVDPNVRAGNIVAAGDDLRTGKQ